MWTFTMKKVYTDYQVMMYWNSLMKIVTRHNPLLRGLRVVEVHPGTAHAGNIYGLSHGLHFHCLFNQRVSIHWIRRIASKWGFGHIDIRQKTKEQAYYLGKYLTKAQPQLLKGTRRWGTIGWTGNTKTRDIKVESEFHRNIETIQRKLHVNQLSTDVIHSIYMNSRIWGDIKSWPINKYEYSNRSSMFFETEDWRKNMGPVEGTGRIKEMSPRGDNRRTREQSMEKIAKHWKEMARRRSIGHEGRIAEDWEKKQRERRVESETKPSEKIFYIHPPGHPRGLTGEKISKNSACDYSFHVEQYYHGSETTNK